MKLFLLMLGFTWFLQPAISYGSITTKDNYKVYTVKLPSYKELTKQYGIKLKWHQRIKYRVLKFTYDRLFQDEEKKIKRAKNLGLASFIAGMLAILMLFILPEAAVILALAALIGGLVTSEMNPKKGFSIAAIIIGAALILFVLLVMIIFALNIALI